MKLPQVAVLGASLSLALLATGTYAQSNESATSASKSKNPTLSIKPFDSNDGRCALGLCSLRLLLPDGTPLLKPDGTNLSIEIPEDKLNEIRKAQGTVK